MSKIEKLDHPQKPLIAFTDGNDNGSTIRHDRVVQEIQESAVLVYFVAIGSAVLVDSHTLESYPTSAVAALFTFRSKTRLHPFLKRAGRNWDANTTSAIMCRAAPGFITFA